MGSPITFSGFNNIDFSAVLNAIMQQERAPIAAFEAQRTSLQAKHTAFASFATKLAAVETAVEALAAGDQLSPVLATSTDELAVGVSAGSATATGQYDVVVSELARSQVTVSQTAYASPDDIVATAGVISLTRFNDPPVDITITGSMTLEDVAAAINGAQNSPVNASVVQVSPGQYRLVLTGRATGTANAFTVQNSTPLSGGAGLGFVDTDGDGISGDTAADNTQSAINAAATVNGVAITSGSNTIQDAVPGVTLQLRRKDPTAVISIDVTKDHAKALEPIEKFATAYNDLLKFIGDQNTVAASGRPAIARDPLVRGLRDSLRGTMLQAESSGTFTRLAEIGIGFDRHGKVTIDKTLLRNALNSSPDEVKQLFGGTTGAAGRFGALKQLISGYTAAGGLVADVQDRIDTQVASLGTRIANLEDQLAVRRAALQKEFIAADRAMSQLSSQGNSLSQLSGQFRLF